MITGIPKIVTPDFFKDYCDELLDRIMKEGKVDKETWSISFENDLPKRLNIIKIYLRLISDSDEIIDHLNIVIDDLCNLPEIASTNRSKILKKYLLLTRLFFYEVSRLEDIFGRFLKNMQNLGFLTKKDRKELKNMFYEQMEVLFKIRNKMLHEYFEWGEKDREIQFMSTLDEKGFEPKLVPLNGGEEIEFDKDIRKACVSRADYFTKLGRDLRDTMNNYISISARWLDLHGHLKVSI